MVMFCPPRASFLTTWHYPSQLRILLIFACDWHNDYFDKVALVLVAIDPLINHVVCLVTMVKYREGYARALGLLCTLLKPGEQGVWRSAMTRISSISRRSFSTRSSSTRASRRRSCEYPLRGGNCTRLMGRRAPLGRGGLSTDVFDSRTSTGSHYCSVATNHHALMWQEVTDVGRAWFPFVLFLETIYNCEIVTSRWRPWIKNACA